MKFISYRTPRKPSPLVGLLDDSTQVITPLAFPDGQWITSLHELIERWDEVKNSLVHEDGEKVPLADVEFLAPLRGRDVLCVGYNYKNHTMQIGGKNDYPEHPMLFTKRYTSIVGHGAKIYPHPKATQTLDYEGELGIIIGKGGLGITKEDAWKHVWGATIINDVSARERQTMHSQLYIAKSMDTFCPMGPFAVHASALNFNDMLLETRLNGQITQSQPTHELIFDIPTLISTLSVGTTLMPGDVISTGTPVRSTPPGTYLHPGDQVTISIKGLGELINVVGEAGTLPGVERI